MHPTIVIALTALLSGCHGTGSKPPRPESSVSAAVSSAVASELPRAKPSGSVTVKAAAELPFILRRAYYAMGGGSEQPGCVRLRFVERSSAGGKLLISRAGGVVWVSYRFANGRLQFIGLHRSGEFSSSQACPASTPVSVDRLAIAGAPLFDTIEDCEQQGSGAVALPDWGREDTGLSRESLGCWSAIWARLEDDVIEANAKTPPLTAKQRAWLAGMQRRQSIYWSDDDCRRWQVRPSDTMNGRIERTEWRDGVRVVISWTYGITQSHPSGKLLLERSGKGETHYYADGSKRLTGWGGAYPHPLSLDDAETIGAEGWYRSKAACLRARKGGKP